MPVPRFDDLPPGPGGGGVPRFDDLPAGKPTEAPIDPMLPLAGASVQETAKDIGRGIIRGGAQALEAPPFQPPGTAGQFVQSPGETAAAIETARGTGPAAFAAKHVEAPHTTVGQYAEPITAGALTAPFQPGGPITKAATTIGGTLGAKAGGDLAEALDLPPAVGGVIGGVIGGGAAGTIAAGRTAARARNLLPTSEANRASSKAAFDQISNAGLVIEPTEVNNFATGLRADLDRGLFSRQPGGRGEVGYRAADQIERANGDLATVMNVHGALGGVSPGEGSNYAAAMLTRDAVREWIANLQPNQVIRGDPGFTSDMWAHARDTWRVHSNLEEIYGALESAEWRRAVSGRGTNLNTLRQNIRRILDNDRLVSRYSPEAQRAMREVVEGDLARNTMRRLAAFAPHGPVSSIPVALSMVTGHGDFGTSIAAGGFIAHFFQGRMEQRSLDALLDIIREGSPLTTPRARTAVARARQPIAGVSAARGALAAGAGSPLAESSLAAPPEAPPDPGL